MRRPVGRDVVVAAAIAILSGALCASPAVNAVHGLSLDVLTALRWQLFGARRDPSASQTVVVAIDEETYQTRPFKGSPTLTWTGEVGRVLTAIIDGGAKVVGLDVIFPTSIEQSEIPFGSELLGTHLHGFDRDFLRALAAGAASGKIVLGEIQQRNESIGPSPGQRIAVHREENIRPLNVYGDPDDVIRRVPLSFTFGDQPVASMALELASRALGQQLVFSGGHVSSFNGRRVTGAIANTQTLNFEGGADDIPTYSFADLRFCLDKGDQDFFRHAFEGKVVLLGTVDNLDDRKLTSKRFATGLEGAHAPRCVLPPRASPDQFKVATIAGVYVHATAINNLLNRETVVEFDRILVIAIAIAFAAVVSAIGCALSPTAAAAGYFAMVAAATLIAVAVFQRSVALPLVEPFLAGFASLVLMTGYRFLVADRQGRFIRASFGLYLAPQIVEQMVAAEKPPALGGEIRSITAFFSDIAGFSSFSEHMRPDALVELMNTYLSAMTEIVENCGGYVDKYIGDSIVAVFGAPVIDPNHAINAVKAALLCRDRLQELNRSTDAFQGHQLKHRIGLNSGEALVGNIGSRRRFNYTVMSDTVNLASRLEGANKFFATSIMASEMTVELTGDAFVWRELDAIQVKGRLRPVSIFEPMDEKARQSAGQTEIMTVYREALAQWRARNFAGAAASFGRIADIDPPSAMFLERAEHMAKAPPDADWKPVRVLEEK